MNIALIAAAGWKSSGIRAEAEPDCPEFLLPLNLCPEPLLPLGNGETAISLLTKQLAVLGVEVHIAVGRPGCLFPRTAAMITNFVPQAIELSEISPWSEAKVFYVGQFGRLHVIEEPDERTGWDSICLMLDNLDATQTPWTKALLVLGDSIFPPGSLEYIVNGDFPCWYISPANERIFWLDRVGVTIWRDFIWRVRTRETNTEEEFSNLTAALAEAGANLHKISEEWGWFDIDHWRAYEGSFNWINRHFKQEMTWTF